jgi:hypothetical protein
MPMTKDHLELLTAFTIMSRRAVDRLRDEYLGGQTYGTSPEQLRAALDKLRSHDLPESLKDKEPDFYVTLMGLSEALFEQLMLSQQLLKRMYNGSSATYLHSFLLDESFDRSEKVLRTILDLAMEGALGKPRTSLRA